MSDQAAEPAHDQAVTNRYVIHYPAHPARTSDPHYRDFDAYRRRTQAQAVCAVGAEVGDFSECADAQGAPIPSQPNGGHGLELHHAHIEFALENGVDLALLEHVYPGVSNPDAVGAWVESAANLQWLCARHHREQSAGVHHLSAADFEAAKFVRGLAGPAGPA